MLSMDDSNYTRLDNAIASFLVGKSEYADYPDQSERLRNQIRTLSSALASGHSCIQVSDNDLPFLLASGLVSADGDKPLVLENSRLYLQRYWHYETRLATQLAQRVSKTRPEVPELAEILDRYFESKTDETDWQRRAAEKVSAQTFSIITGGPGTGKTTTVLKILAIIQELEQGSLSIAMAAPTGKAAMRLQESIGAGKQELECSDEIKQSIPDTVSTIHRLLGARPDSPYFRHNADNPLVYDLVVVDEASMVDLALMAKLVDALKPDARLILLGDKDQLASVESGAILSDLSEGLKPNRSELKKAWRFIQEIKELSEAINKKDKDLAWQLLSSEQNQATGLVSENLLAHIMACSEGYFSAVKSHQSPKEIFKAYRQFQVLCSNRKGKLGVEGINQGIEKALQARGYPVFRQWYPGKPVIVTRNDQSTQLYNGDVGICLQEEGELYIFFEMPDGSIKKLLPARLPQHETAYALTVHKSQGSEFEHVLVVLPETTNPVLGKELVYTAVTRAKQRVEIASSRAVFDYALSHQVERASGLQEKIRVLTQTQ